MQFSHLSKFVSSKQGKLVCLIITWIFRILLGGTFIFSGVVKAIDPWGTIYKFEDYFIALGFPLIHQLLLIGALLLSTIEFLIGVCIITGSYRKSSPIACLIFMFFMLPLTLWIATSNPVEDCGCFGDFLIISNWATFGKNVVLTLICVWLVKFNKQAYPLITPYLQWIAVVISTGFILLISFYGYFEQPLIDFRPYPEGEKLIESEFDTNSSTDSYVFIYEKDGIRKEFSIDDELPSESDGWKYVERKMSDSEPAQAIDRKTLRIWDQSGEEDLTEEILDNHRLLIIFIPELATVSPATTWKINAINEAAENSDIKMIAIVSGSSDMIEEWKDLSMPNYDILTAEDTAIKEVIRGNPSIAYLEDGIVKWKTSLGAVDVDDLTSSDRIDVSKIRRDGKQILLNYTYLFIACISILIVLSLFPSITKTRSKKKTRSNESC